MNYMNIVLHSLNTMMIHFKQEKRFLWERVTPSGVYFGLWNFADRLHSQKVI